MMLGRVFFLGMMVGIAGCGDDPTPLQVEFHYRTLCDDDAGGGCPTVDHRLDGKAGAALPNLAQGKLGLECEIVEASDTTLVTSLKVQDRDVNTQPVQGIHVLNGRLSVGSSMSCPDNGFQLFDDNEFGGSCTGLSPGNCQILVNEYGSKNGRLVLEMDCDNLVPIAGDTHRSIENGLLTVQGCHVTKDTR